MQPERYLQQQFEEPKSSREVLTNIKETLGITNQQMARMFRTSPRSLDRWKSTQIPKHKQEEVTQVTSVVNLISETFKPDKIHKVIRRKAEAFDNKSALEMILSGDANKVKTSYERMRRYQG